MFVNKIPQAPAEPRLTLDTCFAPFKRLLWRRREHHRRAHCVRTVFVEEMLGIARIARGLGHFAPVLQHHAQHEQALEGLIRVDQTRIAHEFVEEPGIQQVQDRMLDAPHIVINRSPGVSPRVEHRRGCIRTGEACVVPGRFHERVEGVSLAASLAAATRTLGAPETLHRGQRRTHALEGHLRG